jgi:hypothetical protein
MHVSNHVFTVALLFSQDTHVQAVATIIRDDTARWNEERAFRQRVTGLERLEQLRPDNK